MTPIPGIEPRDTLMEGERRLDTNGRFFPRASYLRTHIHRAAIKNRMSRIDQANVQMKINDWAKVYNEDSFFFRPHSDQEEEKAQANDHESTSYVRNVIAFPMTKRSMV